MTRQQLCLYISKSNKSAAGANSFNSMYKVLIDCEFSFFSIPLYLFKNVVTLEAKNILSVTILVAYFKDSTPLPEVVQIYCCLRVTKTHYYYCMAISWNCLVYFMCLNITLNWCKLENVTNLSSYIMNNIHSCYHNVRHKLLCT